MWIAAPLILPPTPPVRLALLFIDLAYAPTYFLVASPNVDFKELAALLAIPPNKVPMTGIWSVYPASLSTPSPNF